MPPARFHVDDYGAGLLKGQEVFGDARLAGAHGVHDVSASSRTVSGKVAEDFVA